MSRRKTTNQPRISPRVVVAALAGICALGLQAPAAQAQDEWEFKLVPLYLWALNLDGKMVLSGEEVPLEIGFSDAFDRLEMTFTVHFEAWKGDWGILTDLSFVELSDDVAIPVATVDVTFQNIIAELAAARRLGETDFSVLVGARYYSIEPNLIFKDTSQPIPSLKTSGSVLDAFAGFLWRPRINDKLAFLGRVDIGTGDTEVVWNAAATFEYRFKPKFGLIFGYRILDYDLNQGLAATITDYEVEHSGPLAALSINF